MKRKMLILMVLGILFLNMSLGQSTQDVGTGVRFVDGEAVTEQFMFEDVVLETSYKRSNDFKAGWRITGNKAVDIKLSVLANPSNKTILIEHLHVDVFIESDKESFDDLTQDSMDDYFHGTQGGFFINENYAYYETFSIEGSSYTFQQTWSHAYNSHYYSETRPVKFSEERLIDKGGVWGNSLYFVFDVCMKEPSEEYFHKYIITNNIVIDLNGTAYNNEGNVIDELTEGEGDIPGYPIPVFLGVSGLILSGIIVKKRKVD